MSGSTKPDPAVAEGQNQPDGGRPAHVLVVDDKEIVRNFLSEVLELSGHTVTVVETGGEALRVCREEPVHVLVTDLRMEPMSGQELIRLLKIDSPATVPIVLTGYGSVERTVELMRLGAFDVLTKPCRATEILATVEKALAHHDALDANQDLRSRLEAQEGKRQQIQEKLAMIGKLAAGVAHELNNPLDATLRCVRLSKERVQDDPETTEYLDLAHAGLLRMADIVQSLLTFSREAAVEQAPQPFEDLVAEAITGVALALGNEAPRMTQDIELAVRRIHVPRGLHQVVTNLLRNASDACEGQGTITVTGRIAGEHLLLEVTDHGPGIAEDVLPRVFEPFFTTKDPGKGTGLGLPISARLVEKFGGRMSIECPEDGGTIVTVALPAERYAADLVQEAP
ncbi:MAG: hybrid sensor histidine kinase/response regulator [Planctomycetota bacterium]|nr:hybrid sensor histidine kinase/response regulator [Planctomycetota bacterium]